MKRLMLTALIGLTGCAISAPLYPEGSPFDVSHQGPEAPDDGIFAVDYAFHSFATGVLDPQRSDDEALSQCQAWGYVEALRLEEEPTQCVDRAVYGCASGVTTIHYQCA